jgi:heat shock protein HspQ
MAIREDKFRIGKIVRHRVYDFRGVVFDVDPVFAKTEDWYAAIPASLRPRKDQPFYHLYAVNAEQGPYQAYVSEQNLLPDAEHGPVEHPDVKRSFEGPKGGVYRLRAQGLGSAMN